jgi:AraC family transcriptional regulator
MMQAIQTERPVSGHLAESAPANLELVVTELFNAVDCALKEEFDSARDCVRRAATILRIEPRDRSPLVEVVSPEEPAVPRSAAGLAPWQIRKISVYVAENLGTTLLIADLAAHVGLSRFHFSRAFKDTFGDTPHRYVVSRRIEQAQGLMLSTNDTLADIALACGLVDQAHLGRIFRQIVGEPPGTWRRARSMGPRKAGVVPGASRG